MPELVFEFEFFAQLGRAEFGAGPFGQRVLYRGTGGGIVHGDRLNGVMEGPGGDWFLNGPDGYGRIDVRSNIRTSDDALIYMQYQGLVRLTPAVVAMLDGGPDPGGEDDQYFFTAPRLETGDPRYVWVNQTMFLGEGRSRPGRESTTASTGSASSDGCSSSGEHVDQDGPAHPNLDVVLAQELGETGVRIGAPGHDHVQETDNSYYTQPSVVSTACCSWTCDAHSL